MEKPLASCVCVTFNRPKLLEELLFCFLQQDYENKELIILNDQPDVKYVYNDPRVKIYNLSNRFPSLGAKREYSKKLTSGEYIFITDDDDIYYSNHISKLLGHHVKFPEYDIIANKKRYYSEWNESVELVQVWNMPFNGACISKKYWDNTSFPLDKSCAEDKDFIENAKVLNIDDEEPTFHYRWGLDVYHISGLGGDGKESYRTVTRNTPIEGNKIILLTPQICEKVELYYR